MPTAAEMRDKYLEAELALLAGKSVTFGGRSLSMENLDAIIKGRQEWERRAQAEANPGSSHGVMYANFGCSR